MKGTTSDEVKVTCDPKFLSSILYIHTLNIHAPIVPLFKERRNTTVSLDLLTVNRCWLFMNSDLVTKAKWKGKLFGRVRLFATPWTLTGSSVHGILQARILEWVAIAFFLQGIFPTQGLNLGLPRCRQMLYHLSQKQSSVAK